SALTEFWNAWHDLANNPSGASERGIVYERAALLCQAFNSAHEDLSNLTGQINLSIETGVQKINEITEKIADLNQQILSGRINGNPNDLLDKRNQLVTELGQYLDINYYKNEDGSLTVTTGRGSVLVTGSENYELSYDDGAVRWESSGVANKDITDTIEGGKLGGWLDMRDVTIPKYEAELNELAKNIIWEVNRIHSQGVGTERFSDVTGTYVVTDPNSPLKSSLEFGDKVENGKLDIWVYKPDPDEDPYFLEIDVHDDTKLDSIIDTIDDDPNLSANLTNGKIHISALHNCTFAFSAPNPDLDEPMTSVLAALGINTFFTGSSPEDGDYAKFIAVNPLLKDNKGLIAAGKVASDGSIATGDNSNALDMTNLPYTPIDMIRFNYQRGSSTPSRELVSTTLDDYLHGLEGSIGVASQSITRSREYTEVIVNQLEQTRDNISAVSIDEEMTNIIKYQHAYAAAAKLISTGDEMFKTLLEIR
ncbi:MAG: flagellar hook-associated protein FlgK, partial [Deltaproteobacteria bacterium]